jgi:fructan beta-fructosidase
MDYGPDNYAGITWSNTGDRKILIGWMSNWLYANKVPTPTWRSAMTIPRELNLQKIGREYYLTSLPVQELLHIEGSETKVENLTVKGTVDLTEKLGGINLPYMLKFDLAQAEDFSLTFSNNRGEALVIGYEKGANQYFIDRSKAGLSDFSQQFAAIHTAPRLGGADGLSFTLLVDVASVELFADNGLTAMTSIFFAQHVYDKISIRSDKGNTILRGVLRKIKVK